MTLPEKYKVTINLQLDFKVLESRTYPSSVHDSASFVRSVPDIRLTRLLRDSLRP